MKHTIIVSALTALLLLCPASLQAKKEKWTDTEGNSFKGEPLFTHGPYAVFKTGSFTSRKVPLHLLSSKDCVRFHEQLSHAAVTPWRESKSKIALDIKDHVQKLENETLVKAELPATPEPRFYAIVYANHGEGPSWESLWPAKEAEMKLQQSHPGQVAFLFYGLKHDKQSHLAMAKSAQLSWFITDLIYQSSMTTLRDQAPMEVGHGISIVTPDGVPVFQECPKNKEAAVKFFEQVQAFMNLALPENPQSWQDRCHYLKAVALKEHASGNADPVLVGHLLSANQLKQNGVTRVHASIQVNAEGKATAVDLSPEGIPEALQAPISQALLQYSAFVPAITQGKFVESTYTFDLKMD